MGQTGMILFWPWYNYEFCEAKTFFFAIQPKPRLRINIFCITSRWRSFIVRTKKQPWAAFLCHSLVPHTNVDLSLRFARLVL